MSPCSVAKDCRGAIALVNPAQCLSDAAAMAAALDRLASKTASGIFDTLSAPVIWVVSGPAEASKASSSC